MKCPKDQSLLQIKHKQGIVGWSCNQCHGAFLTGKGTQVFSVNFATKVLDGLFVQKNCCDSQWLCPHCEHQMTIVSLEDITLDICHHCQGIWFDQGESERIIKTYGQHPFVTSTSAAFTDWADMLFAFQFFCLLLSIVMFLFSALN